MVDNFHLSSTLHMFLTGAAADPRELGFFMTVCTFSCGAHVLAILRKGSSVVCQVAQRLSPLIRKAFQQRGSSTALASMSCSTMVMYSRSNWV